MRALHPLAVEAIDAALASLPAAYFEQLRTPDASGMTPLERARATWDARPQTAAVTTLGEVA